MRHKIGVYLRVSTDEQAQVIEGSLDTQKHRLQGFVDSKNMQDPNWGQIISIYADEGLSAKDMRRPALQKMLADIRKGTINLILVTDLSRLSRSIMDFCLLLEALKKANAKFLSLKEQFDTSTPAGEMMVFNMINLAQFERRQTSERVAMNFHARAMRGLRNGGSCILGFDRDPEHPGKYIINPVEAAQVRRIFEIYKEEGSLAKARDRISLEGIKPKLRVNRSDKHNLAGRWTLKVLSTLLRTIAYTGKREVNAKYKDKDQDSLRPFEKYQVVKASWPAIVSENDFAEVQEVLDHNLARERSRITCGERRSFLLTGLVYCSDCGRPLTGSSGHGVSQVHRYYVHRNIPGEPTTCSIRGVNAEELETRVLDHMEEVLLRDGYLDGLEARLEIAYRNSGADLGVRLSSTETEIQQIDRDMLSTIRLMDEMKDEGMEQMLKATLKDLKHKKDKATAAMRELKDQQSAAQSAHEDRIEIEDRAREVKKIRRRAKPATLKRLLRNLISAVTISEDGARVGYWGASDRKSGALAHSMVGLRKFVKGMTFGISEASLLGAGSKGFFSGSIVKNGRAGGIRTRDPLVPNQVRYQLRYSPTNE